MTSKMVFIGFLKIKKLSYNLREAHEKDVLSYLSNEIRLQDLAPSFKKEVAELHRASPSATLDKRFIIFFCNSDRTNIIYGV